LLGDAVRAHEARGNKYCYEAVVAVKSVLSNWKALVVSGPVRRNLSY